MRRLVKVMLLVTAIVPASLTIATPYVIAQEDYEYSKDTSKYRLPPAQAKKIIERRAREVMLALKNRDMQKLSIFVDPQKGVRFSPYVYVDRKTARVLSRRQVINLYRSRQRFLWGEEDGSGEPLRLTFRQYFKLYVYRQDLLTANQASYNPEKPQNGSTVNNLWDVYPRSIIVGYHHDGVTAPRGGGMDWQSLYLVFEKAGKTWYLVGIVNDEWTV